MKNTLIALDILFFDSAGRLVNTREDAIPAMRHHCAAPGLRNMFWRSTRGLPQL